MAGKKHINRAWFLLLFLLFIPTNIFGKNDNAWIAVLLSDNAEAYEVPLRSFSDSVDMEVRVFNLHGDIRHDPGLEATIFGQNPSLVFALGAKAAFVAKLWTRDRQDIPVLFAMVLNWQKYSLEEQSNIAGISSQVNPGNQFIYLSIFAPKIKKIGVIYSPENSSKIVDQGRKAVQMLGMELVEHPIKSGQDFKRTYRRLLPSIEGLWILNDPVTYTLENMAWLGKRCVKDRLVCIGQSQNLAEIGLLLSVRPDFSNIGNQASSMTRNILFRGQSPSAIGVMEPLGTNIFVNRRTAELIGLNLSDQVLNLATKIIE